MDRGAALIIALFIMFILFAIALTFYTVSRIQFQTATNVGNTVRAELLSEAATALAMNMLKKDSIDHPNVTSTDHAWTTYFNGLWVAEKRWAFPEEPWPWAQSPLVQGPLMQGKIPHVYYGRYKFTDPVTGTEYDMPGVGAGGELMEHLYVPRFEYPLDAADPDAGFVGDPENEYDRVANRFVFDPAREVGVTYAQRVNAFCDVDNDGDGLNDSIWLPLAQDYLIAEDMAEIAFDFNLDKGNERPDRTRSAILFYPGGYEVRNGVPAWFLTAPLNTPGDDGYITLYNLPIPGLPSPLTASPIETVGGRYVVDSIDNDYDGIINYHVEYYAKRLGPGDLDEQPTPEERLKRIVTNAEFERLVSLGFTEIHEDYLGPLEFRVCTTGEPFCELAGRAAILIRDEAARVNMNAAGAHYVDTYTLLTEYADPASMIATYDYGNGAAGPTFTRFWKPAFWSGTSTGEYLTPILPRVGPGVALKFWNILMGAPNGSMEVGEDLSDLINPNFFYDVTLPGYGFVDDNANALLLAINGIDDNGNGLVDEGTNPGIGLDPEQVDAAVAYAGRSGWLDVEPVSPLYINPAWSATDIAKAVYFKFADASILEGIDEHTEFQQSYPARNRIAENDIANAAIGTFGDRPLPTREYLKRAMLSEEYAVGPTGGGIATGAINRLRPFVTVDSGGKNNRTRQDENDTLKVLGPKLNYNVASAAQMARTFIEDWRLDEQYVYDRDNPQLDTRYLPEDVERYLGGSMAPEEAAVFWTNAFLAGMRAEGVSQFGATLEIGETPVTFEMLRDPRLRAMQLAANIADSVDTDFARTELSTADLAQFEYDPWWYALQVSNGTPPDQAKRPISYTVAGTEAIRINEIMPRPVRRIEAESNWHKMLPDNTTEDPRRPLFNPDLPVGNHYDVTSRRAGNGIIGIPGAPYGYEFALKTPEYLANAVWDQRYDDTLPLPYRCVGDKAVVETSEDRVDLQIFNKIVDPGTGEITYQPNDPATVVVGVPNIFEYRFGPSKHLPPGRYYLTINTTNPAGAPTIYNDLTRDKFKFAVKYVADPGSPGDYAAIPDWVWLNPADPVDPLDPNRTQPVISVDASGRFIMDDVVLREINPANPANYNVQFQTPIIGYERHGDSTTPASGLLFCSGENLDGSAPAGYARDFQAHTVTIPQYPAEGTAPVFLHVAVYYDGNPAELPGETIGINFFDFSQEPDHEWVEVENVSGQPVDISGWELIVGGADVEGNVVTEDKVVMRVPQGHILEAGPPYNRALLAVSAVSPPIPNVEDDIDPDVIGDFYDLYTASPFSWNGIGQVGTPGLPIAPNEIVPPMNSGDTTVPLIPLRVAGVLDPAEANLTPPGWLDDGRGLPNSTEWSAFEAPDAVNRIIQLEVVGLNADLLPDEITGDGLAFIAKWVLRGGVFPNYPEHDGVDNDNDAHILIRDGMDYTVDGIIAHPYGVGIDEGRWSLAPAYVGVPGSFSFSPAPMVLETLNGIVELNMNMFSANLDPYLWSASFQPEWKEYTERRLYPGDNVVVSLFQGPHELRQCVDRITYTERDVVNRAIDDGVSLLDPDTGSFIRPPLHYNIIMEANGEAQPYPTFWPDNTMGLDFYRSLERKFHPLYNGDRFGTQNRWQATDGNYDDWSHLPVPDVSDGFLPAWFSGTPLQRNAAAWDLSPPGLIDLRRELDRIEIRNRPLDSVGDALSLPYLAWNKTYRPYTTLPVSVDVPEGFGPGFEPVGGLPSVVESAVTDAVYLSPGAATARSWVLEAGSMIRRQPSDEQLLCEYDLPCALIDPALILPQAWRPFFLYEISSPTDPEPRPFIMAGMQTTELPGDGNYWLFTPPARPAGLDDPRLLRGSGSIDDQDARWPAASRCVMFASENVGDLAVYSALLQIEWDASSGLQDGTYDLYIDTGARMINSSSAALTSTGQLIQCHLAQNAGERPLINLAKFTDANGNGALEPEESIGRLESIRPDEAGLIWCGPVSVSNNRLGLEIENRSPNHVLNTFAGVILTPRTRTQGRINVNTVETRLFQDSTPDGPVTRRLNVLAGIPGVYRPAATSINWADYAFTVEAAVDQSLNYDFGVVFRHSGRGYYILRFLKNIHDNVGVVSLHSVVDGTMGPALSAAPFAADRARITVNVQNETVEITTITFWLDDSKIIELPNLPAEHLTGTVGVFSANQAAAFVPDSAEVTVYNPYKNATEVIPLLFNQGWAGAGWAIADPDNNGSFHYMNGGLSAMSIYTGYMDWADGDYQDAYDAPPNVAAQSDPLSPYDRAEWLAESRAFSRIDAHWDGRYYDSIMDLLEPYVNPDPQDPADDNLVFWPLVKGPDHMLNSIPVHLATSAQEESIWRLSKSANLLTTRSDVFEILVTVQAGTGEDMDGDGVINYRSPEEFTVTSERKTRTVYERP